MCRLCDWGEIFPPGGEDPLAQEADRAAEAERIKASRTLWDQLMAQIEERPAADPS